MESIFLANYLMNFTVFIQLTILLLFKFLKIAYQFLPLLL